MKKIFVYNQYEEGELAEIVCSFNLDKLIEKARNFEKECLDNPNDEEEYKKVWNHHDTDECFDWLKYSSWCHDNNEDYVTITYEIQIVEVDFID